MDKSHTFSPVYVPTGMKTAAASTGHNSGGARPSLESTKQSAAVMVPSPSVQSAMAEAGTAPSKRNSLVSRNITVAGHRTSARLEPAMWAGFSEICRRERMTMHDIATAISEQKPANTSLTAAIRVFVMAYFRAAATEDGHLRAGHGRGTGVVASVAPAFVALSAAQAMPYIIGTRHPSGTGR